MRLQCACIIAVRHVCGTDFSHQAESLKKYILRFQQRHIYFGQGCSSQPYSGECVRVDFWHLSSSSQHKLLSELYNILFSLHFAGSAKPSPAANATILAWDEWFIAVCRRLASAHLNHYKYKRCRRCRQTPACNCERRSPHMHAGFSLVGKRILVSFATNASFDRNLAKFLVSFVLFVIL